MFFDFNRSAPVVSVETHDIDADAIQSAVSLRQASLENAILFGGEAIRELLVAAPIEQSRPHIFVDTRVSYLMKGWYPSIPGWHTDGVPRGETGNPLSKGNPNLELQVFHSLDSFDETPIYHSITVGLDSPVEFLQNPERIFLDNHDNDSLYEELSKKIEYAREQFDIPTITPHGAWTTWDWWNIHRAQPAKSSGWRLLIRVTESRYPPRTKDFIRSQNQVYVPETFGW